MRSVGARHLALPREAKEGFLKEVITKTNVEDRVGVHQVYRVGNVTEIKGGSFACTHQSQKNRGLQQRR